jgi:hypothetical protein
MILLKETKMELFLRDKEVIFFIRLTLLKKRGTHVCLAVTVQRDKELTSVWLAFTVKETRNLGTYVCLAVTVQRDKERFLV